MNLPKYSRKIMYRLRVHHVVDIHIYIYIYIYIYIDIVPDVPDTSGESKNNIGHDINKNLYDGNEYV